MRHNLNNLNYLVVNFFPMKNKLNKMLLKETWP